MTEQQARAHVAALQASNRFLGVQLGGGRVGTLSALWSVRITRRDARGTVRHQYLYSDDAVAAVLEDARGHTAS